MSGLRRSVAAVLPALAIALAPAVPADLAAQERDIVPVVGAAPGWTTAFGGDAWDGVHAGMGITAIAGIRAGAWRFALVGSRSDHGAAGSLTPDVDILSATGEVRRDFALRPEGVRFHLGGRAGLVHQEFDDSILAVLDLVPGTEVTAEDSGPLFGPVAGASLPVGGAFALDVNAAYLWADVSPFIRGAEDPEPGLSRALSLAVALTAEI